MSWVGAVVGAAVASVVPVVASVVVPVSDVAVGACVVVGAPTIAVSDDVELASPGLWGVLKLSSRTRAKTVVTRALRARLGIMAGTPV